MAYNGKSGVNRKLYPTRSFGSATPSCNTLRKRMVFRCIAVICGVVAVASCTHNIEVRSTLTTGPFWAIWERKPRPVREGLISTGAVTGRNLDQNFGRYRLLTSK